MLKNRLVRKLEKENQDTPILLIDCSNLSYAALNSFGHLNNDGKQTGVIYGFLRQVLSLAQKFKTNKFIFCWDAGVSYRWQVYSNYKKKRQDKRNDDPERKAMHESMILQNAMLIHEVLPALGFVNNFNKLWYEADDLLAYFAKKLYPKKMIMITSDADMYQCLNYCKIWSPIKKELMTKKLFKQRFKIRVDQWAMAKAIGGCSGDNVVGIYGVADPKSVKSKALLYLQGQLKPGKIRDKIESTEGQKLIQFNLPLVTVPYREDLLKRMFYRKDTFTRLKFIQVFEQLKFKSFENNKAIRQWEDAFLKG